MSEIQLKATNVENKPVRIGDLPIIKTNILENAGQMDKGVVGGYNGAFPLTAASEGGIYLLPSTGKFYVCETAYNGAQISAPNSNFVELSVWKNHDRLNNLETMFFENITQNNFSYISITTIGRIGLLCIDSGAGLQNKTSDDILFSLPEKYKNCNFYCATIVSQGKNGTSATLTTDGKGNVKLFAMNTGNDFPSCYGIIPFII